MPEADSLPLEQSRLKFRPTVVFGRQTGATFRHNRRIKGGRRHCWSYCERPGSVGAAPNLEKISLRGTDTGNAKHEEAEFQPRLLSYDLGSYYLEVLK